MTSQVDPVRLAKITDEMIAALSSAPYVAAMERLKKTPVADRLDLAKVILTPDALRKSGVPLPPNMRISSRYFEEGSPVVGAVLTDPGLVKGAWGCACGGAATMCGGAGGGTD